MANNNYEAINVFHHDGNNHNGTCNISTAVAIDKDKNSPFAVRWAVENLKLRDNAIILVHVCTKQTLHPQNVKHEEAGSPTQFDLRQLFLPFRAFCARKKVLAKEVVLHDTDIAGALSDYVNTNSIINLVLGAPIKSTLAWAFTYTHDVPTSVGKYVHDSCSVYVVSKGKSNKIKSGSVPESPKSVTSFTSKTKSSAGLGNWTSSSPVEPSSSDQHRTSSAESSRNSSPFDHSPSTSSRELHQIISADRSFASNSTTSSSSSRNSISSTDSLRDMLPWKKRHSSKNNISPIESSSSSTENSIIIDTSDQGREMTPPNNNRVLSRMSPFKQPLKNLSLHVRGPDNNIMYSVSSSDRSDARSFLSDVSYELLDQPRISEVSSAISTSSQADFEDELKRMKLDLKQVLDMYNVACQEAAAAREKVKDIVKWRSDEANTLDEAKHNQEAVLAIVKQENKKCKAAVEIAQRAQRLAELESEKRKHVEKRFKQDSEAKKKALNAYSLGFLGYRRYSIEEIEVATNYFSASFKIGEGGYGPVYKATLDHTPVAIKVLNSDISEGLKQFQREVEVLSRMRHPHMVLLVGACPEYGCLVYEYMENGSLEDRLYRKEDTKPLTWTARFRIASEIATALNFLHNTKPEPLVHRDLKPANILLDQNYVSKISDVGLSRLLPPADADRVTQYRVTAAAGTFCYIDPEYQQTGILGTKSDVYSLGVLLLQIITGRSPMGLMHQVESAIERGSFEEILDPTVEDWPLEDTLSYAKLALQCCELRRRDRPDLDSVILPELERLRDLGSEMKPEGRFYYMCSQDQSYQLDNSSSSQVTRDGVL